MWDIAMTTPFIAITSFILGVISARILCYIREKGIKKKFADYHRKNCAQKNISILIGELICPPDSSICPYNKSCETYHHIRTHDTLSRVIKLIEKNIRKDVGL